MDFGHLREGVRSNQPDQPWWFSPRIRGPVTPGMILQSYPLLETQQLLRKSYLPVEKGGCGMSLMSCKTSWYSKANQFPKSIYCSENVMVMAHLCQNHPSNKQEAQRQIEQMKVGRVGWLDDRTMVVLLYLKGYRVSSLKTNREFVLKIGGGWKMKPVLFGRLGLFSWANLLFLFSGGYVWEGTCHQNAPKSSGSWRWNIIGHNQSYGSSNWLVLFRSKKKPSPSFHLFLMFPVCSCSAGFLVSKDFGLTCSCHLPIDQMGLSTI